MDHLYDTLVERSPERAGLSAVHLSESVLNRLEIGERVIRNYRLEIPRPSGVVDSVFFDYRFDDGATSLMQRVALTYEDERSWDSVHAAAWDFQQAREQRPVRGGIQPIALVKGREPDAKLRLQLALLRDFAATVELDNEEDAALQLGELLGLRRNLVLR